TPAAQVLFTMQRSPSLGHARPSLPITGSQLPVAGLQTPTWHASGTGAKKQSFGDPTQRPFLHAALMVQRSPPAGTQPTPSLRGVIEQLFMPSSQVMSLHWSGTMPHAFCAPPTHRPETQWSSTVQNCWSSHVVPVGAGAISHCPLDSLQCASWHC